MRRSKTEIYLHLVWSTRNREPLLVGPAAAEARRSILTEARDLGCEPIALGGVDDHLHLLIRVAGKHSPAEVAKQLKGASSHSSNRVLPDGEGFAWQEGYGAFSISRSHVTRVTEYIENQATRHAEDRLWPEWEETDEEARPRRY